MCLPLKQSKSLRYAGGGLLIVGQEQDVKGGGFSAPESFVGTLSRLNMWQSWLGQSGVNSLMHSCDDYAGSLVAWPDFLAGLKGSVEKKDSLFCGGVSSYNDICINWMFNY